jgi:hypothetical protein
MPPAPVVLIPPVPVAMPPVPVAPPLPGDFPPAPASFGALLPLNDEQAAIPIANAARAGSRKSNRMVLSFRCRARSLTKHYEILLKGGFRADFWLTNLEDPIEIVPEILAW